MPTLARPGIPDYTVSEISPLLDSANMTPARCVVIGREIVACYDEFDGSSLGLDPPTSSAATDLRGELTPPGA